MNKRIILRLSNEIGNQMFMYASAYSLSKEMNRELFLDNETAFLSKKNISKYALDNFKITSHIVEDKYKFKNFSGYLKRKFLLKINSLRSKKKFFIEKKNINKVTSFDNSFVNKTFHDHLYLEGHFESQKYFINHSDEIKNQFQFINYHEFKNNSFFNEICNSNSVSVCIRQNRFNEGRGKNNLENINKSSKYSLEQINYINKASSIIKSKIPNAKFYLWSNDFSNLKKENFNFKFTAVNISNHDIKFDIRALNLFLISNCKHFIVTPSTFNWWGAWLSNNKDKIIIRPNDNYFSLFKINNLDFWPETWLKI